MGVVLEDVTDEENTGTAAEVLQVCARSVSKTYEGLTVPCLPGHPQHEWHTQSYHSHAGVVSKVPCG